MQGAKSKRKNRRTSNEPRTSGSTERDREREREREKIQRAMILLKRRIWDRAVMMRKMVG